MTIYRDGVAIVFRVFGPVAQQASVHVLASAQEMCWRTR